MNNVFRYGITLFAAAAVLCAPTVRATAQDASSQKSIKIKVTKADKDGKMETYEKTASSEEEMKTFLQSLGISSEASRIRLNINTENKEGTGVKQFEHKRIVINTEGEASALNDKTGTIKIEIGANGETPTSAENAHTAKFFMHDGNLREILKQTADGTIDKAALENLRERIKAKIARHGKEGENRTEDVNLTVFNNGKIVSTQDNGGMMIQTLPREIQEKIINGKSSGKIVVITANAKSDDKNTITAVSGSQDSPELSVFPSPNNGQFTVRLNSPTQEPVTLRVLDMFGNTVMNETASKPSGAFERSVNLSSSPKGAYMLEIRQGGKQYHKKFVIEE